MAEKKTKLDWDYPDSRMFEITEKKDEVIMSVIDSRSKRSDFHFIKPSEFWLDDKAISPNNLKENIDMGGLDYIKESPSLKKNIREFEIMFGCGGEILKIRCKDFYYEAL